MDKKICAYVCSGCGIGDALDCEALAQTVASEMSVECKVVEDCLCSQESKSFLQADIDAGVNTFVIGGCSPRLVERELDLGKDKLIVRANLREQVAWTQMKPVEGEEPHPEAKEFLQETAADYMFMAVAKAQKQEIPEAYQMESLNRTIMVMGGGVAGLTAALEASNAGYDVLLVEKEEKLGGKAAGWRKSFPTTAPWTDLEENPVASLIAQVESNDRISVKTTTEVARISGSPGDFLVTFKTAGTKSEWDAPAKVTVDEQDLINKGEMEDPNQGLKPYTERNPEGTVVGAVIHAAGWVPADVSGYEHLCPSSSRVVTNVEFEKMAAAGKVPANVAFIQSPGGAENDNDFPYCNSVTSMVALKHAQYVTEDNEDGRAYILYQHMRTPGHMELFYKSAQNNDGVFMTKANVTGVEEKGEKLVVKAENTLLGDNLELEVDMVVLAAGMEPVTLHENSINLAYRQGPAYVDLDLFDGYADSHFICFPYETRRTGIYTCGGIRKAETIEETIDDATGAALKAIQCLESSDRGVAVHPRSGDATYPEFFMQRCTQCKRCTEECPFGALDDDEKGTPLPNPTRCRRCGTCMGACPERIIGFKDYNIDLIGSMIKAIDVPEDDEDRLRIIVFVCENDAYPALDVAGLKGHGISHMVRFVPVRCLGSVNMAWIRDALSAGMDGAMLLGCSYGDDYQCHFVKGSEIANRRMENIGDTLSTLGLEPERCASEQVAITDYDKIPQIINDFVEQIVEMGPNPFKGF